jgi:hypothetical protein
MKPNRLSPSFLLGQKILHRLPNEWRFLAHCPFSIRSHSHLTGAVMKEIVRAYQIGPYPSTELGFQDTSSHLQLISKGIIQEKILQ